MGSLKRFDLARLSAQRVTSLYETGTGKGVSALHAAAAGIPHIYTVESDPALVEENRKQLGSHPNIHMTLGDSVDFLSGVPSESATPRLFFLDAHFHGGADFAGTLDAYKKSAGHPRSFPLEEELAVLQEKAVARDWIIIDDARLYIEGGFGNGGCPDWAQQWKRWPNLQAILNRFENSHSLKLVRQDEGYFVLSPKDSPLDPRDIIRVFPGDAPGEIPGNLSLRDGVPGVTSISITRRITDHRFATRYFRGQGIDVGPGPDTLALFLEFFPLVQGLVTYDADKGDAQKLANVADGSFDFLYSSHCLEHTRDAEESLRNWIRVVKPGGHLIVQVPDEDLYEQGHWPSQYNRDHKLTFTMKKDRSWSPVSVNVLDLLGAFATQVEILQVGVLDMGYRYSIRATGFDQTRTPMAECAIEFILRRRS